MFMPQRRTEVRLAAATPTLKAGSLSYPTNGLAKANSMAIPTPIRKAASIRPASRNILVCKAFISSGWRAEASRYLPPMRAIPMQAPMAPRPIIRPQARATKATLVMTTPWLKTVYQKSQKNRFKEKPCIPVGRRRPDRIPLMAFVSLTDIHHGQHHEDEGLQQHDQDVEDGPHRPCQHM